MTVEYLAIVHEYQLFVVKIKWYNRQCAVLQNVFA
jgi:hypothetical protein